MNAPSLPALLNKVSQVSQYLCCGGNTEKYANIQPITLTENPRRADNNSNNEIGVGPNNGDSLNPPIDLKYSSDSSNGSLSSNRSLKGLKFVKEN